MAKDHYTSRGLTTPEMMKEALRRRSEFDIQHVELVDIIAILEFKLVQKYPEFRLVIVRDTDMKEAALAEPLRSRITVRQSVYVAACEGDAEARLILAHELGHFLLHREKDVPMHKDPRGAVQSLSNMKATESMEDQADMFARHFLVPPHLAYRLRNEPHLLAEVTGVPLRICRGNITMSKWPEAQAFCSETEHPSGPISSKFSPSNGSAPAVAAKEASHEFSSFRSGPKAVGGDHRNHLDVGSQRPSDGLVQLQLL